VTASPLPSPLDADHTARLPPLDAAAPPPPPARRRRRPGPGGARRRLGGLARRVGVGGRRALGRRAARALLRRGFNAAGGGALLTAVDELRERVRQQGEHLDALRTERVDAQLREANLTGAWGEVEATRDEVEHNRVNLELLKGEVRELQHTLEELGMAFAPATGLAGAPARFAELREAVNGLERRLRNLSLGSPTPSTMDPGEGRPAEGEPPPAVVAPATTSALFNYVGFERRFRGDPEVINATLLERYGDLLADHQPVVDIGCGRGELLESLAARGVLAVGVEPDSGMVAEGRARGVTIHQQLAGEYLRGVPDASLGSIITTHVVEHLPLDALIEMLELAVRKLRPGGVFVSETPNPASLIVLGNSYVLDPTHVMPLHPSLLAFLCESAGFRDVRLRFFSPAEDYRLDPLEVPDGAPEWAAALAGQVSAAMERLNDVLFGPQEYAVVATTPTCEAATDGR
jgi:SAM-dependent methyltransferase